MYPPLTTDYQPDVGADIWLLGLTFIEISSLAAAVELIVGILKCRPPGMQIHLIPLYAWYILVVAVMILFAFPPLIAGDILLEMERAFDWAFFDPARGGDPVLWQHLFWIFGHPEVYIIFLPSIALVAMIVPTFARTPMMGYGWIVLSAIGIGFLSFGLWVHHMFTVGLPGITIGLFSAASTAVAIPTGIQIFCFIATLLVGKVYRSIPILFVTGAFATFVIGGMSGVMVALAPFDFQAHDSYFIVAHLHYVLIGGTVLPILAGFYYYYPLAAGKKLSDRLGTISFWLIFSGFNITFFPMHISGLRGMTRRIFTYPADAGLSYLNLISTTGAFILAAGFAVCLCDVLVSIRRKKTAVRNPWNAGTLEWASDLENQEWGVRSIPQISSRYPLWEQENFLDDLDRGIFYLSDAEEELRETLVTSVIDAKPVQCLRVPGPTFLTFFAAIFTGFFFFLATFHLWLSAVTSGVLALIFILIWVWTGTAPLPEKEEKEVGRGITLPLYVSGPESVGWWAMFITMIGDMTAYVCLVFAYFFYWTINQNFPPAPFPAPGLWYLLAGVTFIGVSWLLTFFSERSNSRDNDRTFYVLLATAVIFAAGGLALLLAAPFSAGLDPVLQAYDAIVWILVLWSVLHLLVGIIMQVYCLARRLCGKMTARYDADIRNIALYWHFTALTTFITGLVVAGFPFVS